MARRSHNRCTTLPRNGDRRAFLFYVEVSQLLESVYLGAERRTHG